MLIIPPKCDIARGYDHGDGDINLEYYCDDDLPMYIYPDSVGWQTVMTGKVDHPIRVVGSAEDFIIQNHVLVKYIGSGKSVTIPAGITEIGSNAFSYEKRITGVRVQEGVTKIGDGAFRHCTSLASVRLPDSLNEIGENAFRDCFALESMTIPSGVTCIRSYAFGFCRNLKTLTLNEGIVTIEYHALCLEALECVTLPKSLTECELANAFYYSTVLQVYAGTVMAEQCLASSNINYVIIGYTEPHEPSVSDEVFEVSNGTLYAYRGPGGSVVIPEDMGITRIESSAFDNRYNVTEITLASTVQEVGFAPWRRT